MARRMPRGRRRAALLPALALIGLASGCGSQSDGNSSGKAGTEAKLAAQSSPCTGYGVPAISQQPVLTGNFNTLGDQIGADCMAWQSFIALNWAADPSNPGQPDLGVTWASFGDPGATGQTVWESYYEASTVFNPPSAAKLQWSAKRTGVKRLFRRSKFHDTELSLSGLGDGIEQAGDNKWLTSQSGNLTYYEVAFNQDEFDYITTNIFNGNDLTTFAGQAACASQAGQNGHGGFNLPVGAGGVAGASNDYDCTGNQQVYGQNVGAIEIKAAWTILPADGSLNYRYLTSPAQITDPFGTVTNATVGLVGLHIIRRVPGAPQFVWSTFEHIDNSPDKSPSSPGWTDPRMPPNPNQRARTRYTFFNPSCTPATDPTYQCVQNALPGTACNQQGQPAGCSPYSAPMQITRITPVDSKANSVTGYVWSLLPANSVFNYYRLVNVQWPANPTPIQPQTPTPLTAGDITPSVNVANSTLETYRQTDGCMTCHQGAPIAQPSQQKTALIAGRQRRKVQLRNLAGAAGQSPPASSYSFVFSSETVR